MPGCSTQPKLRADAMRARVHLGRAGMRPPRTCDELKSKTEAAIAATIIILPPAASAVAKPKPAGSRLYRDLL